MSVSIRILSVIAAFVPLLAGSLPADAAGRTAKAALTQVVASANTWQKDAVLVHLSSTKVQSDGTASEWKYSFYSPKTQRRCVITAGGGTVTVKEVRLGNYTEPLGDFIDSDAAMKVARENGLKGGDPSMAVARPAGGQAASTYWVVTGGYEKGDTSIFLYANTGKFYNRTLMGT